MRRFLYLPLVFLFLPMATAWSRPAPDPREGLPGPLQGHDLKLLDLGGNSSVPETLWFGGTQWDATDHRWEAMEGGVWTFDSGVATVINTDPNLKEVGLHSLMEGWTGLDVSENPDLGSFRRRHQSEFSGGPGVCVGSATGVLGGEWSLWCGFNEPEADTAAFVDGQGYGELWRLAVGQTFAYTGGSVQIDFDYVVETEAGFDWIAVEIDSGGEPIGLWSADGVVSGHWTLFLNQGVELPSNPGDVTVLFEFTSDGAWSDEDGEYPTTCGAFGLDDIVMTGGISHTADFETGDDGWSVQPNPPSGFGDWSDIRSIATLPDEPDATCDLGDKVLVFIDHTSRGHSCYQSNLALSPWIDLRGLDFSEVSGLVLEYGGFFRAWPQAVLIREVQWFPQNPDKPYQGPSEFASASGGDILSPQLLCAAGESRLTADFTSVIPSHAEAIRVAVGIRDGCAFFLCDCFLGAEFNTTPWFDHIRFGVLMGDQPVLGVEPPSPPREPSSVRLGNFAPNPFSGNGSGVISYYLPQPARVRIEIFDLAGRAVITLAEGEAAAGWNRAEWDGTDIRGVPVSGGVYFYRLSAGSERMARRLVLIR